MYNVHMRDVHRSRDDFDDVIKRGISRSNEHKIHTNGTRRELVYVDEFCCWGHLVPTNRLCSCIIGREKIRFAALTEKNRRQIT